MGQYVAKIGNGLDRALGLDTDYISWLTSYPNINKDIKTINDILENEEDESSSVKNTISFQKLLGRKYKLDNILSEIIDLDSLDKMYVYDSNIKIIENTWIVFFNYLIDIKKNQSLEESYEILDFIGEDGLWVDIEQIIEYIIMNGSGLLYFILRIKYNVTQENAEEILLEEFLEMKRLLTIYLSNIHYKLNPELGNFLNLHTYVDGFINLNEYTILNYNYTKTLEWGKRLNVNKIHGNLENEKMIVFGGNIKQYADNKIEPFLKNTYFQYTKMFQLMELNAVRKNYNFKNDNIDELSVIGHSFSPQDYNYFFSILEENPKITIVAYYYNYWTNRDKNESKSNEKVVKENLYKLLEEYENYSGKKISYKMNIEGRIQFKKIEIPNIKIVKEVLNNVDIRINNVDKYKILFPNKSDTEVEAFMKTLFKYALEKKKELYIKFKYSKLYVPSHMIDKSTYEVGDDYNYFYRDIIREKIKFVKEDSKKMIISLANDGILVEKLISDAIKDENQLDSLNIIIQYEGKKANRDNYIVLIDNSKSTETRVYLKDEINDVIKNKIRAEFKTKTNKTISFI